MKLRLARTICFFGAIAFAAALTPAARAQSAPPAQQSSSEQTQQQNTGPIHPPPAATPSAPSVKPAAAQSNAAAPGSATQKYIEVPSGTRLPMILHNAVSTRTARAGDPVYLETIFPILVGGKIVIPAGSYVSGEVISVKHVRRVHGRDEVQLKLNNLILPNGYQASFNATPNDAGTGGSETVGNEGTIRAGSDKGASAGTVIGSAAEGTIIGAVATRTAEGAGVGAGIGAAASLLAVLFTHGPAAQLPRGTTLDATLNRPLYLLAAKVNFTSPGQASALAGPPNRETSSQTFPRIPY